MFIEPDRMEIPADFQVWRKQTKWTLNPDELAINATLE